MLKIGVLGVGHLGRVHVNCIRMIDDFELAGFYDPDPEKSVDAIQEFGMREYDGVSELIDAVDVVDIVTPTVSHFTCAAEAIKKGKHVFIEKPVVATPDEALQLIELSSEAGVKVQVGHPRLKVRWTGPCLSKHTASASLTRAVRMCLSSLI